jgi:hypothetical protein
MTGKENLSFMECLSRAQKPGPSMIQVDIGGHPPFPTGSKQFFWQFWQFTIFSSF